MSKDFLKNVEKTDYLVVILEAVPTTRPRPFYEFLKHNLTLTEAFSDFSALKFFLSISLAFFQRPESERIELVELIP